MSQEETQATPAVGSLEMIGIEKRFPGTQALSGASLRVLPGEIHGLIGENGAGKSTLIKILAGVYAQDGGEIRIGGRRLASVTPAAIRAAGVRFIHQELHLIPHFTVAESVYVGQERRNRWLGLDKRGMRHDAERFLLQVLDTRLDGNRLIRDLSIAERKLVQIARALIDGQAQLVVFDEPTAPLEARESQLLFNAIARLKRRGIAIIYVSHYLTEIAQICDRVTVFRNGRNVGTLQQLGDIARMIPMMVGREITSLFAPRPAQRAVVEPWLSAESLSDGTQLRDVSLQLAPGEIVGIAGLLGSGREALVDTLYGLRPLKQGQLRIAGKPVRIASPAQAIAAGMALVPRDRRHTGLVLPMPVADNINLASLGTLARAGWELRKKARLRAKALAEQLDIRPRNLQLPVRLLSGGNQQKAILARWLATNPQLLILDEPTLGVDIGAKAEIYQLVAAQAAEGRCVLVSSSDGSELIGLCDRILVMLRGEIVANVRTAGLTQDALLALTSGGSTVSPLLQEPVL
ncbi:sugar ABC transporter ATP-binding protein [Serratia inhibens]